MQSRTGLDKEIGTTLIVKFESEISDLKFQISDLKFQIRDTDLTNRAHGWRGTLIQK
jgi:hypothetical protein